MGYRGVISSRDVNEWIVGCPIRITHICIMLHDDGEFITTVYSDVCGDYGKLSYTAKIVYKNAHKESIFESKDVVLESGEAKFTDDISLKVAYASVTVQSVSESGKVIWENDGRVPVTLPEQEIIWQTDPHYDAIKRECSGVTTAKYIPDAVYGAWRCTCGGVNLDSSEKCGRCGVSREWINSHFDREYLDGKKAEYANMSEKKASQKKKRAKLTIPAWLKSAGVVALTVGIITVGVLAFTKFIPQSKYDKAIALSESGDYDAAIEIFRELGDYADSAKKVEHTIYKKAQSMTGIDDVYVSDSRRLPWFSITEDGVLSFIDTEYVGDWNTIIIPDVFDGVIVRELSRNFFINCDELVHVVMSDCTEVIGEQAFYNCTSLERIEFGYALSTIMPRAFIDCTSLEEIEIPGSVTTIGVRAFNNCTSLKKAVLGEGIVEIPAYLFSNCTSLKRITLVSPVDSVGESAFFACDNFEKIFCRFSETEYSPEISDGNDPYINAKFYFDQ